MTQLLIYVLTWSSFTAFARPPPPAQREDSSCPEGFLSPAPPGTGAAQLTSDMGRPVFPGRGSLRVIEFPPTTCA